MLPVQQKPEPPRKRRGARLFAIWAVALAVIVFDTIMARALRPLHFPVGIFSFTTFLASLLLIALTLYGFAVFVRWTLRKLFWRVGRRLLIPGICSEESVVSRNSVNFSRTAPTFAPRYSRLAMWYAASRCASRDVRTSFAR